MNIYSVIYIYTVYTLYRGTAAILLVSSKRRMMKRQLKWKLIKQLETTETESRCWNAALCSGRNFVYASLQSFIRFDLDHCHKSSQFSFGENVCFLVVSERSPSSTGGIFAIVFLTFSEFPFLQVYARTDLAAWMSHVSFASFPPGPLHPHEVDLKVNPSLVPGMRN